MGFKIALCTMLVKFTACRGLSVYVGVIVCLGVCMCIGVSLCFGTVIF